MTAAQAESLCGPNEIVLHGIPELLEKRKIHAAAVAEGYFKIDMRDPWPVPEIERTRIDLERSLVKHFLPEIVVSAKYTGQFRDIISLFITFNDPENNTGLDEFASLVIDVTAQYGGYFRTVDFGDKAPVVAITFGAPTTYENLLERALDCILEIKRTSNLEIKAGITTGRVYAGMVGSKERSEYLVIGNIVNLAARLMMKAVPDQLLVSEKVALSAAQRYEVAEIGRIPLKGLAEKVLAYELLEKMVSSHHRFFGGKMTGREKELQQLIKLCEPVFQGQFGGVIYLYGEAGIGKSRLAHELQHRLGKIEELYYLILQADEILRKSLNPFEYALYIFFQQPGCQSLKEKKKRFDAVFSRLFSEFERSLPDKKCPVSLRELKRIKSIVASIIGIYWAGSVYSTLPDSDKPLAVSLALKEFFKALSCMKPTVLIIEDLHWFDRESLKVLTLLTRGIEDFPIILLVTSRLGQSGSLPVLDLDPQISQNQIFISALSREFVKLFIEDMLNGRCGPQLLDLIYSKSQGNPFYIEQICSYVQENNLVKLENSYFQKVPDDIDIPQSINELLLARIDRLSHTLVESAQLAAVIGNEFEVLLLEELISVFDTVIQPDGEAAIEQENIAPVLREGRRNKIWQALSELKYIFHHSLLRDVLYEMQLKERLRRIHEVSAQCLTRLYHDDPRKLFDIAYHYEKAEILQKATDFYQRAGTHYLELYELDSAVKSFRKAHTFAQSMYGSQSSETADLYLDLGQACEKMKDSEEALHLFTRALEIYLTLFGEQHHASAQTYNALGGVYADLGEYDKALNYSNKALHILQTLPGDVQLQKARTYRNLGITTLYQGDYDQSLEYFQLCLDIERELLGEKDTSTASSYRNLGIVYLYMGQYDKPMAYYEKALNIELDVWGENHPHTSRSYESIGIVFASTERYQEALEYFSKSMEIRITIMGESNPDTAITYNNMGNILNSLNRNQEALAYHLKTLKIRRETLGETHPETAFPYHNIGETYYRMQECALAEQYYLKAISIQSEKLGENHPHTAESYKCLGDVLKAQDKYNEALHYYEKALPTYQEKDMIPKIEEVAKLISELRRLLGKIDRGSFDHAQDS
ncbi:tetratricopeptide repeat protein [candidate division CSSED10-310 bacterium]|uniref:Tetratricopeptide repeat protein n=1 Tax=candidate division CSSED10-310 bacterium TaxID=2855610 RepID=A0ABV6YYT7_UNCC1